MYFIINTTDALINSKGLPRVDDFVWIDGPQSAAQTESCTGQGLGACRLQAYALAGLAGKRNIDSRTPKDAILTKGLPIVLHVHNR